MKNIILYGYPSSGKSFFGQLLAKEWNALFIDTDRLVEKLYQQEFQEKCTCRQILMKMGEEGFRKIEERVIDQLSGVSYAVISLGGRTVLNLENVFKLKKLGKLIYLETNKEILRQRILFERDFPSFLDPQEREKSFERMYEERLAKYKEISPFKIHTSFKTDSQILDELKRYLV